MNKDIKNFILENNINSSKVIESIENVLRKIPAKIKYDRDTYEEYGILRVEIDYNNKNIQPMLFGTNENLERLNISLWKNSVELWKEKMEDISHRGTYLKKEVLVREIIRNVKKFISMKKEANIIEIGCGEGVLIKELVKLTDNVYGSDMMNEFSDKLREDHAEINNNFFLDNIVNSKINKKFDIIICNMLLLDIPSIDSALENIYKLLRKDGILIIGDINSKVYKAIGYVDDTGIVALHDINKIYHTEKKISGHTKAVHNFHPYDYYKRFFIKKGLKLIEDYIIGPTKEEIMSNEKLNDEDKERLMKELSKDIKNPPFHIIVFKLESNNQYL